MKSIPVLLFVITVIFGISKCTPPEGTGHSEVKGIVKDYNGNPIEGVLVEMAGDETSTNKEGRFSINFTTRSSKFVVNFSKFEFGFVSKIYQKPPAKIIVRMAKATVKKIDLRTIDSEVISIVDKNPEIAPPLSSIGNGSVSPLASVPFVYNASGQLIGFEMPTPLQTAYSAAGNFRPPVLGAQIDIPKSGLQLDGDNSTLELSIQTVDQYSEDGMPGDYQVSLGGGCQGFIRSLGAVNFEITQQGRPVKLKQGFKARISIPVDTLLILSKQALNPSVPFLTYNRSTGLWKQEGDAILNKNGTAYEAWTTHFSTFNMDMIFGAAATCYRLCNQIPTSSYQNQKAEISVSNPAKMKSGLPFDSGCGACGSGGALHGIVNLFPFEPVGLRVFADFDEDGLNGIEPDELGLLISTYVYVAGDAISVDQTCGTNFINCKPETSPAIITESFDQRFLRSDRTGMCHIQLALPVRTTSGPGASYPLKISWLYENVFSASLTGVQFDIEESSDNLVWSLVLGGNNFSSPAELVHHFTLPAIPTGIKYYRVRVDGAADYSNVVSIEIDSFGNISNYQRLDFPSTCF